MTVACHYLAHPYSTPQSNTSSPSGLHTRVHHASQHGWSGMPCSHSPQPSAYHNTNGFTSSSHPLSKVLFIFPSRYLFTIGFVSVFSFRWCLPPLLGCIPKQPDSSKHCYTRPTKQHTGFSPSPMPFSKGLCCLNQPSNTNTFLNYNSVHQGWPDSNLKLFPLRSPLLRESLLVSFPPLINMLKFSG